ncbi:MAG: M48 family metallopeptidase [Candidatus Micrarchaeota archaeon]
MTGVFSLLAVLVYFICSLFIYSTSALFIFTGIFCVFFLLIILVEYYKGDKIVLSMNHAQLADDRKYRVLHDTVEGMAIAAGIPKPKVYIIEDPAPNAFATGRAPECASVAVTTGLLQTMNKLELEGVIAHELSHIKNYDVRFMTLVVVVVGLIAMISNTFLRAGFSGMFRGMGSSNNKNSGAAIIIILVITIILAILTPIIAKLIQFAISRKREYLADASGALLTRYPKGLADALEKIKGANLSTKTANAATAALYTASPVSGSHISRWFDTHPPLEDRSAKLRAM